MANRLIWLGGALLAAGALVGCAVGPSPHVKEGKITVTGLRCGVTEEQYDALLSAASAGIVRQGGVPLVSAGTREGCPGGFREAERLAGEGELVFVMAADSSFVTRVCEDRRAMGCSTYGGRVIFLGEVFDPIAAAALAHEVGHTIGLLHSPERRDLMYPVAGGTKLSADYLTAMGVDVDGRRDARRRIGLRMQGSICAIRKEDDQR